MVYDFLYLLHRNVLPAYIEYAESVLTKDRFHCMLKKIYVKKVKIHYIHFNSMIALFRLFNFRFTRLSQNTTI